jgi:AcrR family transcriptional regulator
MTPATGLRRSAEERREDVLQAALMEFAIGGPERTSTSDIAERAGISQPYLYRLYPTKQALFLAAIERTFEKVNALFAQCVGDKTGQEAREAMALAYSELLTSDRTFLKLQMQAYAASTDDEDVRKVTMKCFARLWDEVVTLSGMTTEETREFFAFGMLCNVAAAFGLDVSEAKTAHLSGNPIQYADVFAQRLLGAMVCDDPVSPSSSSSSSTSTTA